jgi:uncharacterized membrane protein YdjX (TVP38/TMEM64 family)
MDRRARAALGVGVALLVALGAWLTSPRALLAHLAWFAADPWRLGAALCLLALVRPLLAWPTTLLAVVAGYGYGVAALPLALALIVLTSLPPFWFARRNRGGGRFSVAGERVVDRAGDLRSVVISRLLPAPSDVVSAAAGVAGVRTRQFALGTAVGELPWATAGVLAGASLVDVANAGLSAAVDPRLVAAMLLVALGLAARPAYEYAKTGA